MEGDDTIANERTIAQQIALLSSQVYTDDVERRRLTVDQIKELCYEVGSRAGAAVPVLVHCLADPDAQVGESASWGLTWCAPESVEPLIDCLSSPDGKVRRRACDALGSIEDAASVARDTLRRLLTDAAEDVRLRAAWALGLVHDTSNRTISALFLMAGSKSVAERAAAFHALGNIGHALVDPAPLRAKQQQIVAALKDDNADVRWSACYVLGSLRLDPSPYVDLLIRCLADTSSRVSSMAISQLKELAPTVDLAEYVAPMCNVVRMSRDEAADVCDVLSLLGIKAKPAVPYLVEALRAKQAFLVIAAARALWKIDRRVEESLPALAGLFDEHGEAVCDAICEIGPAAGPLIQSVIQALQSDDWDLQWAAADALGAISSNDAPVLAVLGTSLGYPSPIVRSAAVRALARIGPPAAPALIKILQDHEDDRSAWAADALGRIGSGAGEASEVLRANLRSRNPELAAWCAIALARITGDAVVMPMLTALLARADRPDLRKAAAIGLNTIGPPAISAADALTSALDDDDADVRTAVEEALAGIKAQAH